MADSYIQLTDDSGNSGKKVRSQTRTVGSDTVHEHYTIIQDETNDYQLSITSAGEAKVDITSNTAGLASETGNLATIAGDTTSLDTKITACNTGAVVVSSSALPSGAATAANQATANTSLSTIAGDTTSLDTKIVACNTGAVVISSGSISATQSGTWNITNISGTVSLPTGAATEATLSTLNGKVTACNTGAVVLSSGTLTGITNDVNIADGGNSITVDAPVGTPVNVQVGDGTNTATVRNLAANDALNVAIVDGSGGHITSFGGGTQYTEDAAAASDPVGTAQILVRQDTPAGLVSTDGDNVARRGTNYGAAFCQIIDSSGNFIDTFGGSGGTSSNFSSTFPTAGTAAGFKDGSGNMQGALVDASGHLQVDVLSGGGSGTEYTFDTDTYSAGTNKGIMSAAVRNDTLATLVDTDNDVAPLQVNASGALYVEVVTSALPSGAATESTLSTLNGKVTACNTGAVVISSGTITDITNTVTVDNGGTFAVQSTLQTGSNTVGKVYITDGTEDALINASGQLEVNVNGTVAATQSGTWNITNISGTVSLPTGAATESSLSSIDGKITACNTGAVVISSGSVNATLQAGANTVGKVYLTDGTEDALINASGQLEVNVNGTVAATQSGGWDVTSNSANIATESTLSTLNGKVTACNTGAVVISSGTTAVTQSTASNLNAQVVGNVAHDASDSGNPIGVGLQARTTNPTAVGDGDRVRATADDLGRQVVVLNQVRDLTVHQHTQIASSSSETTILTAAAGVFHDLTHLALTNETATAVNVTIKDATTGTTRMIIALAANGGAVIPFPVPVTQSAVNNNWTATLSNATTTVNIFVQAVKNV